MTSTPRFIGPVGREDDDESSREPQATRPAAEKVTPSQQGRFLGALEKKDLKKEVKKPTEKVEGEVAEEAEEPEESTTSGNVFHLAGIKGLKEQKGLQDTSTGEGMEGGASEEEPSTSTGKVSGPSKKLQSTIPTLSQQIAAAQAQAPAAVPTSTEGSEDTQTSSSERRAAAIPEGSSSVRSTQEPKAFHGSIAEGEKARSKEEMVGSQGQKKEVPDERMAGGALPKPMMTPTVIAQAGKAAEAPRSNRAALFEVVRQAAEAIATFVSKNESQTVVVIRQPPIFEGATLTVTEYSSAPRQFNITFANLSPDARRLIESVANQQQLKQALVERGYTVQNVVIEAAPRPLVTPTTSETGMRDEGSEGKFGGEGKEGGSAGTGGEAGGAL